MPNTMEEISSEKVVSLLNSGNVFHVNHSESNREFLCTKDHYNNFHIIGCVQKFDDERIFFLFC